jgi:hypothetical protein
MKKTILILALSILLIAVNLYAADGDLIVEGQAAIGTTPINVGTALTIEASTQDSPEKAGTGIQSTAVFLGGNAFTRGVKGAKYNIDIKGASDNNNATIIDPEFIAQENITTIGNTANSGAYTFNTQLTGIRAQFIRLNNNARPMTFSEVYGFWSRAGGASDGAGILSFTNYYHYYVEDFDSSATMKATNQYGLYIPHLSGATNNYGIVLDGDGAGSDIVFGPNQGSSIYSNNGELFAKDSASNVTQISPHDPETGEWIFYSKNTKTGRTVRVNMEELVRDMEKLTGKKYMIESFTEKPQKSVD